MNEFISSISELYVEVYSSPVGVFALHVFMILFFYACLRCLFSMLGVGSETSLLSGFFFLLWKKVLQPCFRYLNKMVFTPCFRYLKRKFIEYLES